MFLRLGHERLKSDHSLGSFSLGEASHHAMRALKQPYQEVHVVGAELGSPDKYFTRMEIP